MRRGGKLPAMMSSIAIVAVSSIFLFDLYWPTILNILRQRKFVFTAESVDSVESTDNPSGSSDLYSLCINGAAS